MAYLRESGLGQETRRAVLFYDLESARRPTAAEGPTSGAGALARDDIERASFAVDDAEAHVARAEARGRPMPSSRAAVLNLRQRIADAERFLSSHPGGAEGALAEVRIRAREIIDRAEMIKAAARRAAP